MNDKKEFLNKIENLLKFHNLKKKSLLKADKTSRFFCFVFGAVPRCIDNF